MKDTEVLSTNEFNPDAFIDQHPGLVPLQKKSVEDQFVADFQARQKEARKDQLRIALDAGIRQNPDQAASTIAMARESGLPEEVVQSQRDEVKARLGVGQFDLDKILDESPSLSRYLTKPNRAAVSHDDVENLSVLEKLVRTPEQFKSGFSTGIKQTELDELYNKVLDGEATPAELETVKRLQTETRSEREKAKKIGGYLDTFSETLPMMGSQIIGGAQGAAATSAVGAATGAVIGAAAGGIGALPGAAAGFAATAGPGYVAGSYWDAYRKARGAAGQRLAEIKDLDGKPLDPELIRSAATVEGLVIGALNTLEVGVIARNVPFLKFAQKEAVNKIIDTVLRTPAKRDALLTLGKTVAGESGLFAALAGVQALFSQGVTGTAKAIDGGEFVDQYDKGEQVWEAMKEGALFGSFFAGPKGVWLAGRDLHYARKAVEQQEWTDKLVDTVNKSKTQQRDPDSVQDLVRDAAQEGGVTHAYVDAAAWDTLFQEAGPAGGQEAAKRLLGSDAQYIEAKATGGRVEIPIDVFTAKLAGSKNFDSIREHFTTESGGMTIAEAKQWAKDRDAEIKEYAKLIEEDPLRESRPIYSDVKKQLKAVGFKDEDAHVQAKLVDTTFQTLGAREKLDPVELYQRYNLEIARGDQGGKKRSAGMEALTQEEIKSQTETPEFKAFFGNSKIKDESGSPLVVYHATPNDFTEFKLGGDDETKSGPAIWFGTDAEHPQAAHNIGRKVGQFNTGVSVIPAFLKMERPLIVDDSTRAWARSLYGNEFPQLISKEQIEQIKADGYDGVLYYQPQGRPEGAKRGPEKLSELVVFDPKQVKSAIGNRGTFDPNDANILRQGAREKSKFPLHPASKYLTEEERGKLRKDTAKKFAYIFEQLPSDMDFAEAAKAGSAARGWYEKSAEAITKIFGQADAPRFAALMAATSPQTSVYANVVTAVKVWKNWNAAGRPSDRGAIMKIMASSVQGAKGDKSVLDAWRNNTVRALQSEDPGAVILSGPKVNSFQRNLRGFVDEVTNDAWMANFAGIEQTLFGGSLNKAGTEPGKGPGYLAMSAKVRRVAAKLTKLSGEKWTPAEVQETVWSWAKTLYELANAKGQKLSAVELVKKGLLSDSLVSEVPTIGTLLSQDARIRQILEEAGYGPVIEAIRSESLERPGRDPGAERGAGERTAGEGEAPAGLVRSARRLDRLREQRAGDGEPGVRRLLQGAVQEVYGDRKREDGSEAVGPDWAPLPKITGDRAPRFSANKPREHSVSAYGVHFSRAAGIAELDPTRAGTGSRGHEARRLGLGNYGKQGGRKARTYFYIQTKESLPVKESVVLGEETYRVRLDNLYDASTDPLGLRKEAGINPDHFEELVMDAGFDGFMTMAIGGGIDEPTAIIFNAQGKKIPVEQIGGRNFERRYEQGLPGEGTEEGGLPDGGGVRGGARLSEVQAQAALSVPLEGLPTRVEVDGRMIDAGPLPAAREAAARYMERAGLEYSPPKDYVKVDPERAKRISDAFDEMVHDPEDPRVKASYDAMIKETLAQWEAIKETGLQVEFIKPGQEDPYGNPRNAIEDVKNNNHLWVYKTQAGESFGGPSSKGVDISGNPLLKETGEVIDGTPLLANDVFRIVHDYFGHIKEGVGFRADGEENAWRQHVAMYSEEARPAVTTETRGQNSWVNFGPFGEKNRKAGPADTEYAPQKIGLLPDWVVEEGSGQGLEQPARGKIEFRRGQNWKFRISLLKKADQSTFIHELGHFYLEVLSDLVEREGASDRIKADYQKLREWAGVGEGGKFQVEHHEKIARGFEAYIREGKAPSEELKGIFDRMRAWMTKIYRSIKELNVELNDDVRGVFDRLLATDEAIADAQREQHFGQLFDSAEEAGMTPEQFRTYQEAADKAGREAREQLGREVLAELKRDRKREMDAAEAEIRAKVEAEVSAKQSVRALDFLQHGLLDGESVGDGLHKIDKQLTLNEYGEDALKDLPRPYIYTNGGMHPDIAAQMFGYANGREMLAALRGAESHKKQVETEVKRQMQERFGEDLGAADLAEQAMAKVHNDRQAELLIAEAQALSRLVPRGTNIQGRKLPPPRLELLAAQQIARDTIAGKRVFDIKPSTYLRAERAAALAAEKAKGMKDAGQAAIWKRRQILNFYLARTAAEAVQAAEATERLARRYASRRGQESLAAAKESFLDAMNDILEAYEFKDVSATKTAERHRLEGITSRQEERQRTKLRDWVQAQIDQDAEVLVPQDIIDQVVKGGIKNYRELTHAELQAIHDSIVNIGHLAKLSKEAYKINERMFFEDAVTDLSTRATESLGDGKDLDIGGYSKTRWEKWKETPTEFADMIMRPETIIETLDGGTTGPWHDLLWDMAQKAHEAKLELQQEVQMPLLELTRSMDKKRKEELLGKVTINSMGIQMSRRDLLSIALNMGTQSSYDKLLKGGYKSKNGPIGFTEEILKEIRDNLSDKDVEFLKTTWKTLESLWPRIEQFQKDAGGVVPPKLEKRPVETPHGTLEGGYYPAVYDPEASAVGRKQAESDRPLSESLGAASSRASTSKSHLKERTNFAAPFLFDYGRVLGGHLDKVLTDLTHRKFANQAQRLLNDTHLSAVVQSRLGVTGWKSLNGWVNHIVGMDAKFSEQATSALGKLLDGTMTNVAVAALGLKAATAWGNFVLAPVQAAARVKPRFLMRGYARFYSNPKQALEFIHANSVEMKHRMVEYDRNFSVVMNKLRVEDTFRAEVARFSLAIHRWADVLSSNAIWLAKYEQSIQEKLTPDKAAMQADKAIRQTQTAGAPKDLSAFERDQRYKHFKLFIGPMLIMQNRVREAIAKTGVSRQDGLMERLGTMTAAWFLPAILWPLVTGRGPEAKDQDEGLTVEDWVRWGIGHELSYPLQLFPLLRDIAGGVEAVVEGENKFRVPSSPWGSVAGAALDIGRQAQRLDKALETEDQEMTHDAYMKILRDLGYGVGLPTNQVSVTGGFLWDVATGVYDPEGASDLKYLFIRRPRQ